MPSKIDIDMKTIVWGDTPKIRHAPDPALMSDYIMGSTFTREREKTSGELILEEVLRIKAGSNPLVEMAFLLLKGYLNAFPDSHTGMVWANMDESFFRDGEMVKYATLDSAFEGTWERVSEDAQTFRLDINGSIFDLITKAIIFKYHLSELTDYFCSLLKTFIVADRAKMWISNTIKRNSFSSAKKWSSSTIPVEDSSVTIILETGDYKIISSDRIPDEAGDFYNFPMRYPKHWMNGTLILKRDTAQREALMFLSSRDVGVGVMPLRHKDLRSLMLGDDWTVEEKMMAEMAGYEDEIWLDKPELSYIMKLRTTPSEMINKWQQTYAFKI